MSIHLDWDRLSVKRRKSVASLAASAREPPVHFQALRVSQDQLNQIQNKKVRAFYVVIYNNKMILIVRSKKTKFTTYVRSIKMRLLIDLRK